MRPLLCGTLFRPGYLTELCRRDILRYVNSHQCFEKVLDEESTRGSRPSAATVPAAHDTAEVSYMAPATKRSAVAPPRVDNSFVLAEQVADRVFREVLAANTSSLRLPLTDMDRAHRLRSYILAAYMMTSPSITRTLHLGF